MADDRQQRTGAGPNARPEDETTARTGAGAPDDSGGWMQPDKAEGARGTVERALAQTEKDLSGEDQTGGPDETNTADAESWLDPRVAEEERDQAGRGPQGGTDRPGADLGGASPEGREGPTTTIPGGPSSDPDIGRQR